VQVVRSSGVVVKEMTNATNKTNRAVDADAATRESQIIVARSRVEAEVCTAPFVSFVSFVHL